MSVYGIILLVLVAFAGIILRVHLRNKSLRRFLSKRVIFGSSEETGHTDAKE